MNPNFRESNDHDKVIRNPRVNSNLETVNTYNRQPIINTSYYKVLPLTMKYRTLKGFISNLLIGSTIKTQKQKQSNKQEHIVTHNSQKEKIRENPSKSQKRR